MALEIPHLVQEMSDMGEEKKQFFVNFYSKKANKNEREAENINKQTKSFNENN
jgi:hypothetical protein